ncbi:antibiotic biosynthesis monooxygenase family protein [Kocuria sp.]|uniref:antibiotic biosynthesis monooxygenase family protein n=1 Tax=Kocuria sp. TaxID=1871328 RepID=UPI0026DF36D6|nr:hypothetical protein [Kocuria sp.]MDO5618088.1 hypothetical protein [Kocuria sp.]
MSVVEIVSFRVKAEVDPIQFAQIDAAVGRDYVSRQPGFLSRETAKGDDGWVVIVHWADTAAADASMASYEQAPAAAEQMSCMEEGSMVMRRFTLVS